MLKRNSAIPVALFCAVELILAILLHTERGMASRHLSFAAVVLACVFCFFYIEKSAAYIFTQSALIFTVAADSILVYNRMDYATLAMCFFSVTQLSYAARLHAVMPRAHRPYHFAVRLLGSLVAILLVYCLAGDTADALAVISLFYFANLLMNAVYAFVYFQKPGLFAIGLLLFVFCDIFVGFSMLGGYLSLPDTPFIRFLVSPPLNMAWVFYLPSQVLLSLSLISYKKGA